MVLLDWPPPDHLGIGRKRGNSCQRKHPAAILAVGSSYPPTVAAQTRTVSAAGIRLDHRKSVRPFKGRFCNNISEFESYMPCHAVASLWARQASWIELRFKSPLGPWSERASSSRAAAQPKSARPIDFCHDFQPIVSPGATGARDCQCFRHASSSGLERQRCR